MQTVSFREGIFFCGETFGYQKIPQEITVINGSMLLFYPEVESRRLQNFESLEGLEEAREYGGSWEGLNDDTVDGRNRAPPGIYETLLKNGMFSISTGAGFLSTV